MIGPRATLVVDQAALVEGQDAVADALGDEASVELTITETEPTKVPRWSPVRSKTSVPMTTVG